ncbi:hypothetical protein VCHA54O485_100033 [Vibrio chagasii]|nr:hypothetical protein VCHA54O485_100033 [Vibrio chagasii]CAH7168079.1 hypothetical protein VCHA54P501_120033 [Vibrio chagasii]CAH7359119.1 hypothetical protein VCHA55P509_70033 [Vibrio chagasii]
MHNLAKHALLLFIRFKFRPQTDKSVVNAYYINVQLISMIVTPVCISLILSLSYLAQYCEANKAS